MNILFVWAVVKKKCINWMDIMHLSVLKSRASVSKRSNFSYYIFSWCCVQMVLLWCVWVEGVDSPVFTSLWNYINPIVRMEYRCCSLITS